MRAHRSALSDTPYPHGNHQSRLPAVARVLEATLANVRLPIKDTVRGTLFLLLLAALLPVLLLQLAQHSAAAHVHRTEAHQANLGVARVVAATLGLGIGDILNRERSLGLAIASNESADAEQVNRLLTEAIREEPAIRSLSWVRPGGMVHSSSDRRTIGTDLHGTPYFQAIQRGRDSAVSDFPPAPQGMRPTFAIATGVRDGRGALLGAIVAVVDPQSLLEAIPPELAPERSMALVDSQGNLVSAHPHLAASRDQPDWARAMSLVGGALSGVEASGTLPPSTDGQEFLIAAAPIRSTGWVALASQPARGAAATSTGGDLRDVGLSVLVAAMALVAALALSRRITEPVRRLREAILAVERGERNPHVVVGGPAELREAAQALTQVAEEIRAREERFQNYVDTICHDLRTPLTVISGHAQRLLRLPDGPGQSGSARKSIDAVMTGVRNMNQMVQELLDSTRCESGQLKLNRMPLDIRAFTIELRDRLTGTLETERIRVDAPERLPRVSADPSRLERILVNLLSNALKYSDPSTEVTVVLGEAGDAVVISVTDLGKGIPSEELPHLFQRFHRTRSARESRDGLGLGLYIAKGLVEAHGGRIWVESEEGERTTFHFTLGVARHDGAHCGEARLYVQHVDPLFPVLT